MPPRTLVVVPCYNEAKRLPLDEFRRFLADSPHVDFLFVNDGSTDSTHSILDALHAELGDRARVLGKSVNGGKAAAVRDGMLLALQSDAAIIGFWDADLATPLSAIDDFLAVFSQRAEVQMVFGARVQLLGREIHRRPLRHYLGRVFATFASMTLQLPIYDTQCGAKLFRATPALLEALKEPFLSRWIFDVEFIARFIRLARGGERVRRWIFEFPLYQWVDVAGSKIRPSDFFVAMYELLKIARRYR